MLYPSIGQYTEAIKLAAEAPEDYFATLTTLRAVLDGNGNPVMSSGNFAVVFKMQDQNDGKIYALKCFTRDQEGRNESYRLIADELQYVESEYLTKIQYLENELFVDTNTDENEFPVLLMDWVEGETLDKYIRKNIDDKYSLSMLAFRFSRLAMWLMPQPFAHGDLKPDNIIVRKDGSLTLVDYDGMYVPSMKGQKSRELGSPDFRHPLRTEDDFDEHIDDFSLSTILLSLKAISLQPSLLEEYGASDRLLFSQNDYRKISECKFLDAVKNLMQDSELTTLLSLFFITLSQNNLTQVSYRLLSLEKPKKEDYYEENLSTKVTDEDIANGVEDEFGVVYSKDGTRLLICKDYRLKEYEIKQGTKVICNCAFGVGYDEVDLGFYSLLQRITIPDSVIFIGDRAFSGCVFLQSITIPNSVLRIGDKIFEGCKSLQNITLSDNITDIGNNAFAWCESLQSITIPQRVSMIGDNAFARCVSLQNIIIPSGVTSIGEQVFLYCHSLSSITLRNGLTSIGDRAFQDCGQLHSLTIPYSVTRIGSGFIANSGVKSVFCNSNLFIIENQALYCNSGKCIHTYFGDDDCFQIRNDVSIIGDYAFYDRSTLQNVRIPNSVVSISDYAFRGCKSLRSVSISNRVTSIGIEAFCGCTLLQNVNIPKSVAIIGERAFYHCSSIQNITIPESVKRVESGAFAVCYSLSKIIIPDNLVFFEDTFGDCPNLLQVLSLNGRESRYAQYILEHKNKDVLPF